MGGMKCGKGTHSLSSSLDPVESEILREEGTVRETGSLGE